MDERYRRLKRATIVLAVLLLACIIAIGGLAVKVGEQESAYDALSEEYGESLDGGSMESSGHASWVLSSWSTSLEQLGIDADVVFFGDSITRGGDFQSYLEEISVVNLGIVGDTLEDMMERTSMISSVSPEKIFIMGGVNSLDDEDVESALEEYDALLDQIIEENPDAEVYVESLLPIGEENTVNSVDNDEVVEFNTGLEQLAESKGLVYIDLHSLYVDEDGFLDSGRTADGLHLTSDSYDLWYKAVEGYAYGNLQ